MRPGRRAARGTATVELALLAPLLVVLVLWGNYFWEVQRARIKMAEMARFVAFERTVRQDLSTVVAEARQRYQDLDGSTKTGTLGTAYQNGLTIQVQAQNADAPLEGVQMSNMGAQAGVGGLAGAAIGALGSSPDQLVRDMGFDPSVGAVQADVQVRMVNRIIPREIALYTTGFNGNQLDLNFQEHFYLFHDTWRAWGPGDNPSQTYPRVEQLTHDRVSRIVYAGVASGGGGALQAIEGVLSVLGLDFPFSDDYIRQSVVIREVTAAGNFAAVRPTRTVPGDVLQAAYWRNDTSYCYGNCEPNDIKTKRGLSNSGGRGDNWPMRSYRCRGNFFQGATFSNAPESEYTQSTTAAAAYFRYNSDACIP
ncbi:pilus assembly protein [Corallococcus carmarthensis]|uniref:pilus assembly protein n=1 Tax=Corallococcus carmarthensis TaxID=2316728 RepID=UPI001FC92DFF|nr:pilus assembly protein [Corallococcus carmarthensis]